MALVRHLAAALMVLLLAVGHAGAETTWPSGRITLVVPFGPGTVTDAATRLFAEQLKSDLGQAVVVENRPGAGATLGTRSVVRAPSDGSIFLIGGNTTHSAAPSLFKNLPYDPIADFTPVARLVKLGSFLAANMEQPFKTIEQLVAYARSHPGKLTYGHGNGGGQIVGETLKKKLGLDIVRLPYSANPQAMTDLLGNNIQLMVPDILNGVPMVEAGRIVALASAARQRTPRLPDMPTLDETVLPGFEMLPWFGMFGPAGLSREIVSRLAAALDRMMSDKAFVEKLLTIGPEPYFLLPDEFATFVKNDIPVWTEHARVAGIEPQ